MADLGARWRLRAASEWSPGPVTGAFVLSVAGAERYSFEPVAAELLVLVAGTLAYSVGFWSALVLRTLGIRPGP